MAAPGFSVGVWAGGERRADGAISTPWIDYSAEVDAFRRQASEDGWVRRFDWPAWAETERGRALMADPIAVATATADELVRLITVAVRSDRFSEGSLAGFIERGFLAAVARRAADLAAD